MVVQVCCFVCLSDHLADLAPNKMAEGQDDSAKFETFSAQFDDQYAKDFTDGHTIWIKNQLIPEIRPVFKSSKSYRILAVGSGSGYADVALLGLLASCSEEHGLKDRKITYTVVEPDPKAVQVCKKNLQAFSKLLNIEFTYEIVPAEKFILGLEGEFELIHFVHVISWLKSPPSILKKSYEKLLAENGTIAVVDFNVEFAELMTSENEEGKKEEAKDEIKDDVWYVKVDEIAAEHKWNCRKFPNTIKQDFTEMVNRTAKGKKQAANFFSMDLENTDEAKLEEGILKLTGTGLKVENIDGVEKHFWPLNETVYFLTKT